MYDHFEHMRQRHDNAPVIWMGDMNLNTNTPVMQNLFRGHLGPRAVFEVDDLSHAHENTYFTGGPAIDHILGTKGAFHLVSGGTTRQGATGQKLKGSDHFPVYAEVTFDAR
jgi:endonuclease/exonuclease/phosphatase family metal-dependent hydrolase